MKIEELERLAVAATAMKMLDTPHAMRTVGIVEGVKLWRLLYAQVLAEFIEQEKSEKQGGAA